MTKADDQSVHSPQPSTKERLLAGAADLVAEQGWGSVTSRAVAQRAGVNNALVHYHFGSVDALLVASLERALGEELASALLPLMAADDIAEGLLAFAGWLQARPPDPRRDRLLIEALAQMSLRADLRERFLPGLVAVRAWFAGHLERQGVARSTALAAALAALLDGLVIHRLLDPDLDLVDAVAGLTDLLPASRA